MTRKRKESAFIWHIYHLWDALTYFMRCILRNWDYKQDKSRFSASICVHVLISMAWKFENHHKNVYINSNFHMEYKAENHFRIIISYTNNWRKLASSCNQWGMCLHMICEDYYHPRSKCSATGWHFVWIFALYDHNKNSREVQKRDSQINNQNNTIFHSVLSCDNK